MYLKSETSIKQADFGHGLGLPATLTKLFLFVVLLLLQQHATCILQALLDYYRVNEHAGAGAAPSSGMQR